MDAVSSSEQTDKEAISYKKIQGTQIRQNLLIRLAQIASINGNKKAHEVFMGFFGALSRLGDLYRNGIRRVADFVALCHID